MVLGKNVKKFREGKGWSQRDLANSAQISQPFISAIENDSKDVTSKVLKKLALALGVSITELIGDEFTPTGTE